MGKKVWVFGLLLAVSPGLGAVTLCSDYSTISGGASSSSATLQQYINLGSAGCEIGNTLFDSFAYSYVLGLGQTDSVDPNVTAAQVQVTVGSSPNSQTLNFAATWLVSSGFQAALDITYTVCALNVAAACSPTPVLPIENSTISYTGTVQDRRGSPADDPSNIQTSLGLAPLGAPVIDLDPSLYPSVCATPNSGCPTNSTTATVTTGSPLPGSRQVSVGDLFVLDSGGSSGQSSNTATLTQVSQSFSDAPEPGTLAAVGMGLAVCGWLAARRQRGVR